MIKTTTCIECRVEFSYEYRRGPTRPRCPACAKQHAAIQRRQISQRYRERDPERNREQMNRYNRKRLADPAHLAWKREDAMKRAYGIGMAEFDAMLAKQDSKCAICGGGPNGPGKRFHVDHCHDTSKVRGLLCSKCNTMLGLADNDPDRLRAAAKYLRK